MAPRVLIVEDNDATRTGLSELLKRAGYETQATRSFEEGSRAMRDDAPDLLIADVRLGPYNGLQLLVTSPKRIPTIIMTGFPDPVLEADAHHLGAQFILKPVAPAALLSLVEEQLASRPAQELSGPTRRWARKQVAGELTARVEDVTAKILDVWLRRDAVPADARRPAGATAVVQRRAAALRRVGAGRPGLVEPQQRRSLALRRGAVGSGSGGHARVVRPCRHPLLSSEHTAP